MNRPRTQGPLPTRVREACARRWRAGRLVFVWMGMALAAMPALAAVPITAGPYRAQVWTDPAIIATGASRIFVELEDASGKPVLGATVKVLAKMPEMDMGERDETAAPVPDRPGRYAAAARFAMEGSYRITLRVTGPSGEVVSQLALKTGQNTGGPAAQSAASEPPWWLLPWVVGGLILAFILYRLTRLGVRPGFRTFFSPIALGAVILLALAIGGSMWLVGALKRPGSMSLVDALSSDMSKMPAPPGRSPVALAVVESAAVQSVVRYTGSAVGFVEQDVYPRVTGSITWMPYYVGDPIRKGQLLAKLDPREYQTRVDERAANRAIAVQMAAIAGLEYQQAQASAAQARGEVRSREGALEESRRMHSRALAMLQESQAGLTEARGDLRSMQADLTAARHEQAASESMLQSAQATLPETEAMLSAMLADQAYWQKQIARMKVLFDNGAVSGEEFQREQASARGADAKVRQTEARLLAVKSDIRAAESQRSRSEAMVESAQGKIAQAQSRIQGMEAKIEQAKAEIAAAAGRIKMSDGDLEGAQANARAMQAMARAGTGKIRQAQAGVRLAEASLATSTVVRDYTEIRSLVDGVVTQRLISPGVLVSPGQAILKIAQIQPIRLQANVGDADLARIRIGARVTVRTQDSESEPLEARVTSISPAMDPVARTGTVEALFANVPRRFLPGQYVRMEIQTRPTRTQAASALRIPSAALRWQSSPSNTILSMKQSAYVWVAEAGADEGSFVVQRVDVEAGASDGSYTEILSGLRLGQQVVVRGHDSLRPGDTVSAVAWGTGGPASLPDARVAPGSGGHTGHGAGGGAAPPPPAMDDSTAQRPAPPPAAANPPAAPPTAAPPPRAEDHSAHGKGGN